MSVVHIMDDQSSSELRRRAEECRVIAGTYHDADTRGRMLRIAAGYDRMAQHSEGKPCSGAPPRHDEAGDGRPDDG
jgi:hypothetical protein